MDTNKMTIVEKIDSEYHRSKIIIRQAGSFYYFAEFSTIDQLDFFSKTLGFTWEEVDQRETVNLGLYREFRLSHRINDSIKYSFWKLSDLPEGAKPIKAHSNGSIVTCYFTNDGETINFYRPNPNAKEVYNPLSIEEHIAHKKIYGSY